MGLTVPGGVDGFIFGFTWFDHELGPVGTPGQETLPTISALVVPMVHFLVSAEPRLGMGLTQRVNASDWFYLVLPGFTWFYLV